MPQIQRADPAARKRALITVGVGAVAGCLLILGVEGLREDFQDWIGGEPEKMRHRLNWVVAALALLGIPLVVAAVHLWRVARSIMESQRFPPPGMAVIRDTPIVTGARARRRGHVLRFAAALTGSCGIVVPAAIWWLSRVLIKGG